MATGHCMRWLDYRGKVVLLSFWAAWCGPCMQMVSHETESARRLAGKAFAVVGVNADHDPREAKEVAAKVTRILSASPNDLISRQASIKTRSSKRSCGSWMPAASKRDIRLGRMPVVSN